mgnify:CR=1 FL=1
MEGQNKQSSCRVRPPTQNALRLEIVDSHVGGDIRHIVDSSVHRFHPDIKEFTSFSFSASRLVSVLVVLHDERVGRQPQQSGLWWGTQMKFVATVRVIVTVLLRAVRVQHVACCGNCGPTNLQYAEEFMYRGTAVSSYQIRPTCGQTRVGVHAHPKKAKSGVLSRGAWAMV